MNISEERLQADCFQWFHNNFPQLRGLMWHVANQRETGIPTWIEKLLEKPFPSALAFLKKMDKPELQGSKFKAIGVISGVSDLHFFYHGKIYFIELKTETGRLSENQVKWIESISSQGAEVAVIRDLQTFQNYINAILNPKEAI